MHTNHNRNYNYNYNNILNKPIYVERRNDGHRSIDETQFDEVNYFHTHIYIQHSYKKILKYAYLYIF